MAETNLENSASFLNYAPIPLEFGTSGLRGLVKDITDLEAYINVKATLQYLLNCHDIAAGSIVVIAGDLRPSSDRIMAACAQAVIDAGCRVENAGKIPTPALVAHAIADRRAGVMVTGSHIPFDRNGIKLNKSAGELLKSDEPAILREVARVRAEEYRRSSTESQFNTSGMLKIAPVLPVLDVTAQENYLHRYLNCFKRNGLAGRHVLVYQHSAVGRDLLVRILRELGAAVISAGRSDTFIPIDTENITDEQLKRLEALALNAESAEGAIDAIVSTDGDSDRPLVCAVLPANQIKPGGRRVRFLPGDLLGIVTAEYLRADAAAVPISANDAVERRLHERNILLKHTKIGSPYVVAALDALRGAGNDQRIVGWEANGGFLTGSEIRLHAGQLLPALPTRDALLPILANLFAAAEQGISLSTLWDRLPARFGRAGLLDNFPVTASKTILQRLIPDSDVVDVNFAIANEKWQDCKVSLARVFTPALGFTDIERVNTLDGVRIYFRNGDIAHIRPSGNAPQLRIYANGDSQARADAIVAGAVREPDGILRQLERALS
ncbi:MAG: phosphomannomutase [Deltaproteobacteria bacterium]|nr:phosphomannomutase [Deltaproteobacteria bacterium]